MTDVLMWYVAGPLFGLVVVAMYLVGNHRLGVSGSYLHAGLAVRGLQHDPWRLVFFVGLMAGAAGAAASRGQLRLSLDYGQLGAVVPDGLLGPLLLVAGGFIGFGARWAGGCTSGNGLAGCSSRSQASVAATVTFFATAVAVTWLLHLVTGGAL